MENLQEQISKHPLANCAECPLKEAHFAPSTGLDKKVAFVSRSPGAYDGRSGIPFSNPRGSKAVLKHLLALHHHNRDDLLLTNVVLCQSDDPPKEAIRACAARLEYEIKDCDLVIAGGAEAVDSLTHYRGVSRSRGFAIKRTNKISGKQQRVVVTNNPAAVVRNSDLYPDMVRDFRRAFDPPPTPTFPQVEIIEEPVRGSAILNSWKDQAGLIASDLEWRKTQIFAAGFSKRPEKAIVFARECFDSDIFLNELRNFYENENVQFIWHNGKADVGILRQNDINARIDEDTFCMSYDLDERPGYHKLEYLLSEHFAWPDYEPKSVTHFKKTGEFLEPVRKSKLELYTYNGRDSAGTFQLHDKLRPSVHVGHYGRLLKAQTAFIDVEANGFCYDVEEACNIHEREVLPRIWNLEKQLQDISGHSLLNPASPKQVSSIYYGEWGLKHSLRDSGKKKFKTSVATEVRKEIEDGRFVCNPLHRDKIVEFNKLYGDFQKITKLKGSFIEGLVRRAEEDGKLYCYFNTCGTVSGRTSSSNPNFQNIAREGFETIPGIRTLFIPSPGCKIVSCDLSQAELRTCAKLSGDKGLLSIYRDSTRSLHKERATKFYGENYTKEQYVKAKNINFGVTYLQSAASFAQMYHMPEKEAQAYIDSWFTDFPTLKEWTKEVGDRAIKEGVIETPFGHRRRFHLITDENIGDIRREAVNVTPQNVAAWLTIEAIIELVKHGVRIVATVHDSIVADVLDDEVDDVVSLMLKVMQKQSIEQLGWSFEDIPFLADASVGPSWGELEERAA
ncbi:MAG TPA: DNA polymerase [Methylomirabilota bacterium]|nr:DNA polymerase [Methylomirabilota bacterium]